MEIQQHDGVVVMELQYSGRASPSSMEEEDVLERERKALRRGMRGPPSPTIYREPREGAPALGDAISKGGRRPRGWLAPQAKWGAPHP